MALIEKHCPNQFKFTISIKMLEHNSPKNSIETEALCVQVKSPLREVAKEIFGMIDQHCLGGGIRIIPQGYNQKFHGIHMQILWYQILIFIITQAFLR